jgi:hypothetical protein
MLLHMLHGVLSLLETAAHLGAIVQGQCIRGSNSYGMCAVRAPGGFMQVPSHRAMLDCLLADKLDCRCMFVFCVVLPAATLVDVVGSLALITQSDRSGVSLAINTLYLNPMPGEANADHQCLASKSAGLFFLLEGSRIGAKPSWKCRGTLCVL